MALLDHTIVHAHDHQRSAAFLAEILGLAAPVRLGPFAVVRAGETTTLDFIEVDGPVTAQHYAFLVTEAEFDEIFARIRERAIPYFADPHERTPGAINTWDGGRGVLLRGSERAPARDHHPPLRHGRFHNRQPAPLGDTPVGERS